MSKASDKKAKQYAADYGYAVSFLKSDPELWALFKKAIDKGYGPEKFQSELPNTKWYKTHSGTYRQQLALAKIDPASFNASVSGKQAEIADLASGMGSMLTDHQLHLLANHAIMFGWNDSQLKNMLAETVKESHGQYIGQAGQNAASLRQSAWRNGIKLPEHTLNTWTQAIAAGSRSVEDYQTYIRNQAKSLAPGYQKELDSGMDLYDIAQPYMTSMASTLEVNPSSVDLFDPTIRKAMSGVTADGKPGTTSLWQFEQSLKQDKRWLGTQNAQDSVMATAHKVLNDFGLMGG